MSIEKLEKRFLPPENWQKSEFINPETGHRIHFEYGSIKDNLNGVVITLPGLSEFCEKYYETAQFFINKGYGFVVIDWAYQGRSSRFTQNQHKRHSDGYESDISDLKYLIDNYINKNIPLFMLGHSMGGHIGLRFLIKHRNYFKSASFSAPMIGIHDLKYTGWLIKILKPVFKVFETSYVPGGKNWRKESRKSNGKDVFSSDPVRDSLHNFWCLEDPALQIGNPTIKWVLESLKSIDLLKKNFESINIATLIGVAELEEIVCNEAIEKIVSKNLKARLIKLREAKHEILMETDNIRNQFLNETLALFKKSI
jgi:lysophospholipase